ncbi:two-component system OmpR family response regulator [Microbacteriaceae bacterium SG_E_30_P1]|uniref:Two-component system OmpR family response regulator n=1 Tax=Antiquaquibacter oligotrophicus TaxID=2880260 RepID=A0ABT6KLR9_9MICO|nr:winged helix-turn-helix domain-containing protein [Antiquaquibacter oligotrophicus]MDH6180057.1 two-component system OmpR family response regulator [Antiquaquibacter oligotrophicus]UDF14191.1 winged helix-turn-helix domain-containing protein [Antiquaquibacter oligotrophicus]
MRPQLLIATVVSTRNQPTEALVTDLAVDGIDLELHDDGANSLLSIGRSHPDVVVVPTDVHGVDLLDYVDAVRRTGLPILVALADDTHKAVAVEALDHGARCILGLPLGARELEQQARLAAPEPASRTTLQAGSLTMDLLSHRVSVDGKDVYLSAREFQLLQVLLAADRVMSADELAEVASDLPAASVQGIRVMIGRIRRKLEGSGHSVLETVRGVGYRITR